MNALLVIDIQKEFVSEDIIKEVKDFMDKSNYNLVLGTIFENKMDSNFTKLLHYYDCMKVKPELNCEIVKKSTYGLDSTTINRLKDYQVDVIGTDIDACVMAVCYQLFDAGINFKILTKYCYGSLKTEALEIMKRNFGKAVI